MNDFIEYFNILLFKFVIFYFIFILPILLIWEYYRKKIEV